MTNRRYPLAGLATVFLFLAAVFTTWAYRNYERWIHDTYIEPDLSLAEADEVLLWIQVPTAMVCWLIGGVVARKAFRDW